jgi:GTPase SAR1 family protein
MFQSNTRGIEHIEERKMKREDSISMGRSAKNPGGAVPVMSVMPGKIAPQVECGQRKSLPFFVLAQRFLRHPMGKCWFLRKKLDYIVTMSYFVRKYVNDADYANARLDQYRSLLVSKKTGTDVIGKNELMGGSINGKSFARRKRHLYLSLVDIAIKKRYLYSLLIDIAFILFDRASIKCVCTEMKVVLNKKKAALLDQLFDLLFNDESIPSYYASVADGIWQFRTNRRFIASKEIRLILTGNMSTGKSTLINAIVGKPIARTSQEACTANMSYLYNKPFEDDAIHLLASPLNLRADYKDLRGISKSEVSQVASYFRAWVRPRNRVCIIDTPGVNSSLNPNRNHRKLAHEALTKENYDVLLYVFSANRLGTDEEYKYLKHVSENVPKDKVVFILNKLDDFKNAEDSIEASIADVRKDLRRFGYENPVICPLSAYFALLIKMKQNGEVLSEDENDIFDLYVKKFSKPEYDLSRYNGMISNENSNVSDLTLMGVKCGLYGLENILFGGMLNEKSAYQVQSL